MVRPSAVRILEHAYFMTPLLGYKVKVLAAAAGEAPQTLDVCLSGSGISHHAAVNPCQK